MVASQPSVAALRHHASPGAAPPAGSATRPTAHACADATSIADQMSVETVDQKASCACGSLKGHRSLRAAGGSGFSLCPLSRAEKGEKRE